MNNTTESFLEQELCSQIVSNKIRTTRIVVYTIVACATYFGNILILISLRKFSKQLKGTPYILIGNLAVADLLLAIGLTLQIIGYIFKSLMGNAYFCVVKTCILAISLTASGVLLMFISLDRFCAIVFPMKHLVLSTKCRRRRIRLTIIWVLSLAVICIPVITNSNLSPGKSTCNSCDMISKRISLALAVFIPVQFIINVIMCLIVIWRLKTNTMSKRKYKKSMIKCGLLIRVYVAFAICWSPYVVTTFLIETTNEKQKYLIVRQYTAILGLMNSAMNWIIYGLSNMKLRDSFKNVLFCRHQRQLHFSNYIQAKSSDKREYKTTTSGEVQPCETCETLA
ncbi:dopamine receptor 2-like [Mercenaria mercenaria]|uniref:dopamine receptor 2-like n=1 Tax=Mercenaria mercenaria TaxID=6596 RepID=UPI00234E7FEB|nr:dopamine receptor 2-like [Mercenaria mercenaria]